MGGWRSSKLVSSEKVKMEKKDAFKSACRWRSCTGLRRTAREVSKMPTFTVRLLKLLNMTFTPPCQHQLLAQCFFTCLRQERPPCAAAQVFRARSLYSPIQTDWMLLGEISRLGECSCVNETRESEAAESAGEDRTRGQSVCTPHVEDGWADGSR